MVKFRSEKGLCQLKTDTCHIHLQRLNHGHCHCWPSIPLKGVQDENQEWGTLCSGEKTGRTGLQIDLFKKRLYESQILHLLIPRETLTSLTVKSALAIKEKFTIKSPNRAATVQTSWEITRWCYGCTFRLDLVLLNTWDFWGMSSLDATILKTMYAGS